MCKCVCVFECVWNHEWNLFIFSFGDRNKSDSGTNQSCFLFTAPFYSSCDKVLSAYCVLLCAGLVLGETQSPGGEGHQESIQPRMRRFWWGEARIGEHRTRESPTLWGAVADGKLHLSTLELEEFTTQRRGGGVRQAERRTCAKALDTRQQACSGKGECSRVVGEVIPGSPVAHVLYCHLIILFPWWDKSNVIPMFIGRRWELREEVICSRLPTSEGKAGTPICWA